MSRQSIRAALAITFCWAVLYLCGSFAMADFNIVKWTTDARGLVAFAMAFCAIMSAVFTGAIPI